MKYYPHTPGDIKEMLEFIGAESVDSLFSDIPKSRQIDSLGLPPPLSESEVVSRLNAMATKNRPFYDSPCFLGAGIYRHFSPSVVDAVLSRSEFYTAYTPYQAEASQGMLQSIFEYQTMICLLTGMDVSNASMYDGATACAEAVSMALSHTGNKEILLSAGLHPEYREVVETYFRHTQGVVVREIPLVDGVTSVSGLEGMAGPDTAGVIIQNPNCLGFIEPAEKIGQALKAANKKSLFVVAVAEPHSLGILKNPGSCGADVAVGEAGIMGLPPSFGGPHAGFMAARTSLLRKLPGRIVGQTVDHDGRRAFCLTLQAREQHIRREKAASNICTNQSLCALAVTVYLSCLGRDGFRELAEVNLWRAHYLKDRLLEIPGFRLAAGQPFFNEFTLRCPDDPVRIDLFLKSRGMTGGFVTGRWKKEWSDLMTFSVTEMNTRKEMDDLAACLGAYCREEAGSACTKA